jgi:hypothetical protein
MATLHGRQVNLGITDPDAGAAAGEVFMKLVAGGGAGPDPLSAGRRPGGHEVPGTPAGGGRVARPPVHLPNR